MSFASSSGGKIPKSPQCCEAVTADWKVSASPNLEDESLEWNQGVEMWGGWHAGLGEFQIGCGARAFSIGPLDGIGADFREGVKLKSRSIVSIQHATWLH